MIYMYGISAGITPTGQGDYFMSLKETKVVPKVTLNVRVLSSEKSFYQEKDKDKKPLVDADGKPRMKESKNWDIEIEFSDGVKVKGFDFVDVVKNFPGLTTISSPFPIKVGAVGTIVCGLRNGNFGLSIDVVQFVEKKIEEAKK